MKAIFLLSGALSLGLVAVGCDTGGSKDDGSGDDTGRDFNDGDDGSGGGGGGGSANVDCSDDTLDTTPPAGPDCLTGSIHCGETIVATTEGGSTELEEVFYEAARCFIPYENYDGPERVYELILDGNGQDMNAIITLDAPCQELAMGVFYMSDDETECPNGTQHNISTCYGEAVSSGFETTVYITGQYVERYFIAVDGPSGTETPFSISVDCQQ